MGAAEWNTWWARAEYTSRARRFVNRRRGTGRLIKGRPPDGEKKITRRRRERRGAQSGAVSAVKCRSGMRAPCAGVKKRKIEGHPPPGGLEKRPPSKEGGYRSLGKGAGDTLRALGHPPRAAPSLCRLIKPPAVSLQTLGGCGKRAKTSVAAVSRRARY